MRQSLRMGIMISTNHADMLAILSRYENRRKTYNALPGLSLEELPALSNWLCFHFRAGNFGDRIARFDPRQGIGFTVALPISFYYLIITKKLADCGDGVALSSYAVTGKTDGVRK